MAAYIHLLFPEGVPRAYAVEDAAALAGFDPDAVRRLSATVWPGRSVEWLAEDDITLLRTFKFALEAGLPESAVIELHEGLRGCPDARGRGRDPAHRLLLAPGRRRPASDAARGDRSLPRRDRAAVSAGSPVVDYFHRKALLQASRLDVARNLAEQLGLATRSDVPGQMEMAVAFVDLSSFTPMTAEMGDLKAAEVLQQFSQLVRESAAHSDGSVVKQIGDAFMIVFPQAASAVACLLEIERRVGGRDAVPRRPRRHRLGQRPLPRGRLRRLARQPRLAPRRGGRPPSGPGNRRGPKGSGRAGRTSSSSTLASVASKGSPIEFELFEARAAGSAAREKVIDPVCGMELGPSEVAVSLTLDGVARSFCSEDCLRKFVVSPERYNS